MHPNFLPGNIKNKNYNFTSGRMNSYKKDGNAWRDNVINSKLILISHAPGFPRGKEPAMHSYAKLI